MPNSPVDQRCYVDGILAYLQNTVKDVVSAFYSYLPGLDLIYERGYMAQTDCITISSSDDEVEEIPHTRSLPLWASDDSRAGHGGQSRRFSPAIRSSSNVNKRVPIRPHFDPGSSDVLNRNGSHAHKSYSIDNVQVNNPRIVNYPTANTSGSDFEKLSSEQALKRTLPLSIQSSSARNHHGHGAPSSNMGDNASSSHLDNYGNRHDFGGLSTSSDRSYMQGPSNRDNDGNFMNQNSRSRILPHSLNYGKPPFNSHFASTSDSVNRPGVNEENAAASDERLIYQAALEDLNQPKVEASLPEGLLSVSLLRHQKIALAWMLQKENRSLHCLGGILADDQGLGKTISMIALIQMQRSLQSNSRSDVHGNRRTEALNLDDDEITGSVKMGHVRNSAESENSELVQEASSSNGALGKQRPAAGTLVVCPASVLRQWARELDDKVADQAKLKVLIYHGGTRTKDPVELAKYDVVLTTYSIVTNEVPKQPLIDDDELDGKDVYGLTPEFFPSKKRKKTHVSKKGRKKNDGSSIDCSSGPLARVGWFRVILDEAQTIKNHRTLVARACCSLRAKRRWCLSGTPIQNTIDDLYSYFRFLKYDPYAAYKSFYSTIKVPISRNAVQGYKKLQAVLRAIMMRRTKGTVINGEPIINLPPKNICLNKVDFSMEERAFYAKLEADSRSQFKAYAAAGTVNQNYANILLMLLRLRQACDHPFLIKDCDSNSGAHGRLSVEMAKCLPKDMLINLLNCLETSFAICSVCDDPPEDPVVTMCSHVFCYQCVSDNMSGDDNTCPARGCKEQLGEDVVFSKATLRSCMSNYLDGGSSISPVNDYSIVRQSEYSSSKIRAVLEILHSHSKLKCSKSELHGSSVNGESSFWENTRAEENQRETWSESNQERPEKVIIFSQWTSMLDLVELALNQACIEYRRLDGTMSLVSRDKGVKDFNTDPEVTVMLMSLKAGNLGLNMVAASHVILLDLWWNPTTEDQAVDRAHRIGQTRPVTVTRLTVKDTVEDRILALQEEKRKMVASAFGEEHAGASATRLTVEDLKYLFMV